MKKAVSYVLRMLGGRCCPEPNDVACVTEVEIEQEMIIDEINVILDRLSKVIAPKNKVS